MSAGLSAGLLLTLTFPFYSKCVHWVRFIYECCLLWCGIFGEGNNGLIYTVVCIILFRTIFAVGWGVSTWHGGQSAFDLEMRGGKAVAEDAVAKKPSGKEMFVRHLVVEEVEESHEDGMQTLLAVPYVIWVQLFFVYLIWCN